MKVSKEEVGRVLQAYLERVLTDGNRTLSSDQAALILNLASGNPNNKLNLSLYLEGHQTIQNHRVNLFIRTVLKYLPEKVDEKWVTPLRPAGKSTKARPRVSRRKKRHLERVIDWMGSGVGDVRKGNPKNDPEIKRQERERQLADRKDIRRPSLDDAAESPGELKTPLIDVQHIKGGWGAIRDFFKKKKKSSRGSEGRENVQDTFIHDLVQTIQKNITENALIPLDVIGTSKENPFKDTNARNFALEMGIGLYLAQENGDKHLNMTMPDVFLSLSGRKKVRFDHELDRIHQIVRRVVPGNAAKVQVVIYFVNPLRGEDEQSKTVKRPLRYEEFIGPL